MNHQTTHNRTQSILPAGDDWFYKNSIIKPKVKSNPVFDEDASQVTNTYRVVIDSRSRNLDGYPNPNSYQIELQQEYKDITQVELVYIKLPLTSTYVIHNNMNTLYFNMEFLDYNVQIPNGKWDPETALAGKIQDAMNSKASGFTVIYNSDTDNYTFKNGNTFILNFDKSRGDNNLATLLGFARKKYNSKLINGVQTVTSPFQKYIDNDNYAIMYIDRLDINESDYTPIDQSFAVVGDNYINYNISDSPKIIKYCSPPMERLSKLWIYFLDKYGQKYDFQNRDHRFELLISTTRQSIKYKF
jgi:hypothetical protein